MAAFIRHGSFASALKSTAALNTVVNTATARYRLDIARHSSNRVLVDVKAKLDAVRDSLVSRGFLRPQRSYEPPEDTSARLDKICEDQAVSTGNDAELKDPVVRFKLFVACEEEFKHSIPSSLLHTIEHVGDLKRFYLTPVDNATPYEALRRIELPKNLHVQQDYHRFHPDTDTMFNGKTAFPKSSTLVTGLKYKKKYPGHMQENPWLYEQMKI